MMFDLQDAGYQREVVWITRDMYPCAMSQVRIGHVKSERAAYQNILRAMSDIPEAMPHIVTYAGLVKRPAAVLGWLMPRLGLPVPDVPIFDADAKWWED